MERKFISISGLKKVLSPKEMKNITGGSNAICHSGRECVCGAYCGSDSECESWYGKGSTCASWCGVC
jgi:hypothetical protein